MRVRVSCSDCAMQASPLAANAPLSRKRGTLKTTESHLAGIASAGRQPDAPDSHETIPACIMRAGQTGGLMDAEVDVARQADEVILGLAQPFRRTEPLWA